MQNVPASLPPTLIRMAQVAGRDGSPVVLPAESFVVSTLPAGPRDVVRVSLNAAGLKRSLGPLTVTIPNDSAVLIANVGRGTVNLRDYHGGTFIIHVHTGQTILQNVGGDGFVQVLRGSLFAIDSNFNRLRVRTALAAEIFQHCRARQIEASSVAGAIVYDAGSFEQGLARFDSGSGNVAVGVTNPAQLTARTGGSGKVYTLFDRRAQVEAHASDATATFDGGGPLVNATSVSGNVYLYDGALASKRRVPAGWRPALVALHSDDDGGFVPAAFPGASIGGVPTPPPVTPPHRRKSSHPSLRP